MRSKDLEDQEFYTKPYAMKRCQKFKFISDLLQNQLKKEMTHKGKQRIDFCLWFCLINSRGVGVQRIFFNFLVSQNKIYSINKIEKQKILIELEWIKWRNFYLGFELIFAITVYSIFHSQSCDVIRKAGIGFNYHLKIPNKL